MGRLNLTPTEEPGVIAQVVSGAGDRNDLPPGAGRDLVHLLRRLAHPVTLTNDQIARRARISPSYLSEIRSGRKTPRPDTAQRIVEALGGRERSVIHDRSYLASGRRMQIG